MSAGPAFRTDTLAGNAMTASKRMTTTAQVADPLLRANVRVRGVAVRDAGSTFPKVARLDTRSTLINVDPQSGRAMQASAALAAVTQTTNSGLLVGQVLAEWHGQVIEVREQVFTAELRGTIGQGVAGALEEAEIPIDEVRPEDRMLLLPGYFFRLCANFEIGAGGNRRRYTDIVFRRMPAYRREELEQARARALEVTSAFRLE